MHRTASLALLTALLLALVLPASAALAQQPGQEPGSGAFQPLPPPAPEPTATPEPIDTSPGDDDSGDVGRPVLFAAGGGLIALFAVIGLFISRDARRSLPRHGRELETGLRDEGPHRKAREAKAKARAKARKARQARKRNRVAR